MSKPKPDLTVTLSPYDVAMLSNQMRLGNGCVCDSGCDSCARLADAFEAMREALEHVKAMAGDVYLDGHPEWETMVFDAVASLSLARKVRP